MSSVLDRKTHRRRHRYLRDARHFFSPTIICIIIQSLAYLLVATRTGRSDWANLTLAVLALALVPLIASFVLTAFRRHSAPIMVAVIVSAATYSFAVSGLSAIRLPVSYQALLACLPIPLIVMSYANVTFQLRHANRAALAPFQGAADVAKELNVPVLELSSNSLTYEIDTLLIDPLERYSGEWPTLIARVYLSNVEIMPWMQYMEHRHGRLDIASFQGSSLAYTPGQVLYARAKRILDVAAVLVTSPITLPLAALTALYIGFRDGFPVIFVQVRRGYGGRPFRMYKFRTMYRGSSGGATSFKDARILPGCEFIRRFRLDEIPQLVNVLIGEMSLVGPRPEAVDLAKRYEKVMPQYLLRLLVLPGLTGWAQVNSGYSASIEEARQKLSYDLYYIKHISLDLDLLILFKTLKTLILRHGAR